MVQRLDGFVSLDAGRTVGTVLTRPFTFDGNSLVLNLSAKGFLRAGLLDLNGKPIPGFATDDCDPLRCDSTNHLVTWHGKSNLAELAGRPVRLMFEMQHCKLYAFQFIHKSHPPAGPHRKPGP